MERLWKKRNRQDFPSHRERLRRVMRYLRSRSGSIPATFNDNRVALFPDGAAFFSTLFAAIESAQSYILLEYYIIRDDCTGCRLSTVLRAAARRGVKIFVLYDYLGSKDTSPAFFREMAECGIETLPFNILSFRRGIYWFDKRDHRKMAVFDGKIALLGGYNIGDSYALVPGKKKYFRDVGFSVEGGAVGELVRIFSESWQIETGVVPAIPEQLTLDLVSFGEGAKETAEVTIIAGGPHHRRSYIRAAFRVAMAAASKEIIIANPYFVPGPRVIRSILRAARRGVSVRLLLPFHNDVPIVRIVSQGYYATLLKNGVQIFEYDREVLHAKVMVVDRERTIIGSANMDQRSFHRNFEINGVIDCVNFGVKVAGMLDDDCAASRRITLDEHEKRGLPARLLEKIFSLVAWFL